MTLKDKTIESMDNTVKTHSQDIKELKVAVNDKSTKKGRTTQVFITYLGMIQLIISRRSVYFLRPFVRVQ